MRCAMILLFVSLTAACVPGSSPLTPDSAANDTDTVWLYFLNGVASADSIAIWGPSGTIGEGIGFGDRWTADGPCGPDVEVCMPIPVSRADGTTFEVRTNGRRVSLDLAEKLHAFYPHETGTIILRSGGEFGVDATVVRHPQSISSECNPTVINGLSVGDEHAFDLAVEVERHPENVGYLDESQQPVVTRCGSLPTNAPEHTLVARADLAEQVGMWFVHASCDDGPCLLASVRNEAPFDDDGRFDAYPTTIAYYECLAEAVEIAGACPSELSWDDVEIDAAAVAGCSDPLRASAVVAGPGDAIEYVGGTSCDLQMRFRTPGLERVFGPESDERYGKHGDGSLIGASLEVPRGSTSFVTLLGQPVNPLVWQWESANTFIDLESIEAVR